jgi:uroporphyrinogen-III decarboxylase
MVKQTGEAGITTNAISESPLMIFVEWLAGIENAHYLLADYQDEVEDLFDAIQKANLQSLEMYVEHSPADVLYFIENTSTTLISPDQYHRYCYNHVQEYGAVVDGADYYLGLHMCGHLKALLPDLAKVQADAFEAFTSAPVGNTSLLDGRSVCPDKCLIGGTNATMWVRPAEDIIAEIKRDLDALPHHRGVAVTSAGVMPPLCAPDTIKQVADWVKQYSCS